MYFKKMQRSLAEKDPAQGVRAFIKQGLVHRMLEANVPHQVITDTLGHSSRSADKPYISMEDKFLKDCALDLSLIGKVAWKELPNDCL